MESTERRSMIFAARGKIFFIPLSRTRDGLWVNLGPDNEASQASAPEELGHLLLKALHAGEQGVRRPDPGEFQALTKKLVQFCGFRSWKSFGSSAALAHAHLRGDELRLERWHWDGKRSYLPPEKGNEIKTSQDPLPLGGALLSLFGAAAQDKQREPRP